MSRRQKWLYVLEATFNILVTHIPSHAFRQWWLRRIGVAIGPMSSIFRGCTVQGPGGISIGSGVTIGWRCHLDGRGGLTIGDQVSVASDAHIITADHDPNSPEFHERRAPVAIGDYAWIATRSMILPGVVIGDGAIVAGGSVVRHTVGPYEIVAGIPASKVGDRTHDLRYRRRFRPLFY